MRPSTLLLCAALVAGANAAPAAPPPDAGSLPLKVRHQVMPVFPRELLARRVDEGYVRVAIAVDADGKVDDCLPIDYSDQGFVPSTLACLREWTFDPARIDGRPVDSTVRLAFHFVSEGPVVVSMAGDEMASFMTGLWPRASAAFRTYDLRDLDAIPRPVAAAAPAFPAELARAGHTGTVTVHFYIDPTGAVRMPSVDPGADRRLAALAVAALQHWRFEPPRRDHRAVQVYVSQIFNFRAPDSGNRGSSPG